MCVFKKNNKLFHCFWSGNCASSWIQSLHSRYCFNSLTQLSVHLFPECLHVCLLITWSCNIHVVYRFDMRMWIIFEKWRQSRFFMAFRFISFKSHCWFSLKRWVIQKKLQIICCHTGSLRFSCLSKSENIVAFSCFTFFACSYNIV